MRSPDRRRTGVVLVVGSVLILALHILLVRGVQAPTIVADEAGYLGNARWLSGRGPTWIMAEAPYYGFGYSLALAPLFALIHDPDLLYRAVLVVNSLLVTSLFPLLYVWCRRVLGVTERVALIAALVGGLVPAATAYTAAALAEAAVLPLLVGAAITCRSALRGQRVGWLFPVVVALLLATHSRFTLVVPLAALVLVVAGWAGLLPARRWIAQIGLLGVLCVAVIATRHALLDARWTKRAAPEGTIGDLYRTLTSLGGLKRFASGIIGQTWYVAAGSLALALVGVVVLAARLRTAPTSGSGLRAWLADAERLSIGFVLAAIGSVFALSVAFFSRYIHRGEFFIYGRHNEGFMPLLVAAGVAFLVGPARPKVRVRAALAAGIGTAVLGGLLAVRYRHGELQRNTIIVSIPAVARFSGGRLLLWGSLVAVLAMGTLAIAAPSRRWREVVLAGMAAWFVFAGVASIDRSEREQKTDYETWTVPERLRELGVDSITVAGPVPGQALQSYQWFDPDIRFEDWPEGLTTLPSNPYVLAPARAPELVKAGARIAMLDTGGWYPWIGAPDGLALWVQPGPEQDRLARAGELLPAGFPGPLPEEAQGARLSVRPSGPVRVEPNGRWTTTVDVEHLAPTSWPDHDSWDLPGRVQVVGRLVAADGAVGDTAPLPSFAVELPEWSRPGDRFSVDLEGVAVDGELRPLPPGSYVLRVGLTQDGFGDFDPGAAPTVDVPVEVTG